MDAAERGSGVGADAIDHPPLLRLLRCCERRGDLDARLLRGLEQRGCIRHRWFQKLRKLSAFRAQRPYWPELAAREMIQAWRLSGCFGKTVKTGKNASFKPWIVLESFK